jgi:Peptidase family M23
MLRSHRTTARSFLALLILWVSAGTAIAAVPERIVFPVVGKTTYTDDFGAPRSGHRHQGNDLMAARGSPVVAVEGGVVRKYKTSWGGDCMLYLDGRSGTTYYYIHLNNDVTRGDDNRASDCRNGVAYAPGLRAQQRVRRGQLIGYVGNSGNAAGGATHLHFELHPDGGRAVSPYHWLRKAPRALYAVPPRVTRVRLGFWGSLETTDETVTLDLRRLAVSKGWRGLAPTRGVSLALAEDLLVQRRVNRSTISAAELETARSGERMFVLTTWFAPSLATQIARAGVLSAARITLLGED